MTLVSTHTAALNLSSQEIGARAQLFQISVAGLSIGTEASQVGDFVTHEL